MYKQLSEGAGHPLTRTDLAKINRRLYRTVKTWENEGKIVPFLQTIPYSNLYLQKAGKIRNLLFKINDTPRNKARAYNVFLSDYMEN